MMRNWKRPLPLRLHAYGKSVTKTCLWLWGNRIDTTRRALVISSFEESPWLNFFLGPFFYLTIYGVKIDPNDFCPLPLQVTAWIDPVRNTFISYLLRWRGSDSGSFLRSYLRLYICSFSLEIQIYIKAIFLWFFICCTFILLRTICKKPITFLIKKNIKKLIRYWISWIR